MVKRKRPVSMGRRPTVSVVVPCYNYGRYLPQLVASLLAEERTNVEVLIIDDCSSDDSAAVAEELAARHDRVRAILHETNRGHISTYNEGLAAVTGDYVVLLSADDLLPCGAIDRAVALMEAHPRVGFVYGWVYSFTGEAPSGLPTRTRNWSVWDGRQWLSHFCRTGQNAILSPEVVMRREAMTDMVGYDPRLPQAADMDLWMRTALRWDVGRVNGPVQAWYRVHGDNMHLTRFAGLTTDLWERRRTFELLYDEHATGAPEIMRLRPRSMEALARQSLRLGRAANLRGEPQTVVMEYGTFATDTFPEIKGTRQWRAFEAGPATSSLTLLPHLHAFSARLRIHAEWRRWRRYGT